MRDFLSEYISTLSGKRRERVYDFLSAAKVDKADLDGLANRLSQMKDKAPISLTAEQFGAMIDVSRLEGAYRDVFQRMTEMYDTSNQVSLMLDTYVSVLSSEIKAIEDEIVAMKKAMSNYAFTLADNGAYDFSWIETFNDDTMRQLPPGPFFTDRSGVPFPSEEQAYVNSASGTLTLTPALDHAYSLTGQIMNSNCAAYVTSTTGLQNALNGAIGSGWRVAVSAPRPISASLSTNPNNQGAQFEVEISLVTPSPSDTILLTPFSDRPFELLKLEVFFSADNTELEKLSLVSAPRIIDRPTDFGFALGTVMRVRMLVSQSVYNRGKALPFQPEETYRKLHNEVKARKEETRLPVMTGVYRRNNKALMHVLQMSLKKNSTDKDLRIFRSSIPQINFDPTYGPMNVIDILKTERRNHGHEQLWKSRSQINTLFRRMIHEKLLSSNPQMIGGNHTISPIKTFVIGGSQLNKLFANPMKSENVSVDQNVPAMDLAALDAEVQFLNYEYELGFRNIQIGRGQRTFRGVFVSKPVPAQADSGEVRMKTSDTNFDLINSDRNSKQVTSTEYSVTNKSEAKYEEDWVPIMPINEGTIVYGERLFFSDGGAAQFRFPVSKQGLIRVYRNGYDVNMNILTLVDSPDKRYYKSVRIPISSLTPTDIFTVDYDTYGDQTIINFEAQGLARSSVATAHDNEGAGETFIGTYNSRSVSLSNEVYVDYDQVDLHGSYSSVFGFQGTYQPVTIVMADGTVALNQTNYFGLQQNSLNEFDETKTAFIHSGRNIIFNKPITERFTVYYQYLPSNLRFRAVMRVNDINYVSPQIDSVQIKAKTRTSDVKRIV